MAAGVRADFLIGKDGIAGVTRVQQRAVTLIGINTGIMYPAAILSVPTVALNGPTSQYRWGPIGPFVANVRTLDGSGGFQDLGFEIHGHSVMDKITVEGIVLASRQLHIAVQEASQGALHRIHSGDSARAPVATDILPQIAGQNG